MTLLCCCSMTLFIYLSLLSCSHNTSLLLFCVTFHLPIHYCCHNHTSLLLFYITLLPICHCCHNDTPLLLSYNHTMIHSILLCWCCMSLFIYPSVTAVMTVLCCCHVLCYCWCSTQLFTTTSLLYFHCFQSLSSLCHFLSTIFLHLWHHLPLSARLSNGPNRYFICSHHSTSLTKFQPLWLTVCKPIQMP